MKILLHSVCLLSFSLIVFSQTLIVHKNDGTVQSFSISQIDSITFTTSASDCPPTVLYESKTYNTILIGDQCWLRENLDVGIRIDGSQNASNDGVIEKYCYNDDPANCITYGGYYQWNEAMQYDTTQGIQGICPSGWHLPTLAEFQTLATTANNNGNVLKEIGQGSGGGEGTNTSGFSALLAGGRTLNGSFAGLGTGAYFWTSSEYIVSVTSGIALYLNDVDSNIDLSDFDKVHGFSIRCIKD